MAAPFPPSPPPRRFSPTPLRATPTPTPTITSACEVISTVDGQLALVTTRDCPGGTPLLEVPGDVCITAVDAQSSIVGPLLQNRSDLVQLALWLLAEQAENENGKNNNTEKNNTDSPYKALLLASLRVPELSPLLWTPEERADLLRGSAVGVEAETRLASLRAEWASIESDLAAADPARAVFAPATFHEEAFVRAFCTVVASSTYLEAAQCFALVPYVAGARRVSSSSSSSFSSSRAVGAACQVDYDLDTGHVILVSDRMIRAGKEVVLGGDERPNLELALALGSIPGDESEEKGETTNQNQNQNQNPYDYVEFPCQLLKTDTMYLPKKQIVEQFGFTDDMRFPVYPDRTPVQMLAYCRLARVQDPADLAKISFEKDVVVSTMNEYEVLQILLGDCKERLNQYADSTIESDVKLLQQLDRQLSSGSDLNDDLDLILRKKKERLAARLRLGEKRIVQSFMDAVRRRLAPIRGIPTKGGGMEDPNQDILDMFNVIEAIPQAPQALLGGLARWARGEDDPEWKRKGGQKKK